MIAVSDEIVHRLWGNIEMVNKRTTV